MRSSILWCNLHEVMASAITSNFNDWYLKSLHAELRVPMYVNWSLQSCQHWSLHTNALLPWEITACFHLMVFLIFKKKESPQLYTTTFSKTLLLTNHPSENNYMNVIAVFSVEIKHCLILTLLIKYYGESKFKGEKDAACDCNGGCKRTVCLQMLSKFENWKPTHIDNSSHVHTMNHGWWWGYWDSPQGDGSCTALWISPSVKTEGIFVLR